MTAAASVLARARVGLVFAGLVSAVALAQPSGGADDFAPLPDSQSHQSQKKSSVHSFFSKRLKQAHKAAKKAKADASSAALSKPDSTGAAAPAAASSAAASTSGSSSAAPSTPGSNAATNAASSGSKPSPQASSQASSSQPPAQVQAVPPGGAPAQPERAQTADEAFNTRVKTLEEQVVDLKEKIFRTKARLLLLQETVLGGDLSSGARAVLFHRNEMGSSFVLESVAYALDGAPIFTKVDVNGDLDKREELEIFNGRIVPGQHQIAVRMVYRGHGYGIFSYLEGYKFKVQSSYTFNAEAGKVTTVKVRGYEKGGLTTDLKDRPAIGYDTEVTRDSAVQQATEKASSPPPSEAAPKGQ